MRLIKLTGMTPPERGDEVNHIYVDPFRIIVIAPGLLQHRDVERMNAARSLYDGMYAAACKLADQVTEYIPPMADPVAVGWMMTAKGSAQAVSDACSSYGRALREDVHHPPVHCTEIQLSCGTALEHGVMLARVWVKESPDEVAEAVRQVRLEAVN